MNTELKKSFCEEIQTELETMKGMEVGSDTYRTTVDGITKLTDRVIEMDKIELDRIEKNKNRESETFYKNAQMADEKKSRLISNCITIGGLILQAGLAVWGTKKTFEFEKEGTVTTIMGRGFINKLLPKK